MKRERQGHVEEVNVFGDECLAFRRKLCYRDYFPCKSLLFSFYVPVMVKRVFMGLFHVINLGTSHG